jgi:hypothetical protein
VELLENQVEVYSDLYLSTLLTFGLMSVVQGIILKGWIDLTSGKDAYAKKAGKYFDEGLKEKADVFALMGKVRRHTTLVLP